MAQAFDSALYGVCERLRSVLLRLSDADKRRVFEIRLRENRPVVLTTPNGCAYIGADASLRLAFSADCLSADAQDVQSSFELLCEYSLQSHENELKNGYIAMKHGHRAGIGGEGVMRDGAVVAFRKITSVNLRIARSISGVAPPVLRALYDRFGSLPASLIFGPPGCGKTTLLRDAALQLSKNGRRVVLIDEKGELSGGGLAGDLDVLSGVEKAVAAQMAIRNLNPEWLLFDEVGSDMEAKLIQSCFHCGVKVMTTLHAGDYAELCARSISRTLLSFGALRAGILLQKVGAAPQIYDLEEQHAIARTARPVCVCDADRLCEKSLS